MSCPGSISNARRTDYALPAAMLTRMNRAMTPMIAAISVGNTQRGAPCKARRTLCQHKARPSASASRPVRIPAREYAGTVMLAGTTLSEGRGTTRPLELFGAPDVEARAVIGEMERIAPAWLDGCRLRDIWFQPTFHKPAGQLCNGEIGRAHV